MRSRSRRTSSGTCAHRCSARCSTTSTSTATPRTTAPTSTTGPTGIRTWLRPAADACCRRWEDGRRRNTMLSLRRSVLRRTLKALDLCVLALALGAAAALSRPAPLAATAGSWLESPIRPAALLALAALLSAGHGALLAQRLYRPGRAPRPAIELWTAARAALVACGAIAITALLLGVSGISVRGALALPLVAVAGMAGARGALRLLVTHRRDPRHVLVVGSGERAIALAQRIRAAPELGCRLLGVVDDPWPGLARARLAGIPVLGSFADLPHLLRDGVVDDVVLCLPLASRYREAAAVVALCEEQGIAVRLDAALFPSTLARGTAAAAGETPTVTLYPGAIHGAGAVLKRALDIALSLTLLVLLAPVFLVVAVLIKLDSPGPVFFLQQRRGLNKRPFRMIKFRTMRQDAERLLVTVAAMNEEFGPAFKIRNDPRVTRVGRYLRRTSIDELPQLINVLRGEMSLVGPRPLFHWEYDRIQEPWIKRRCSVKPGLTGLWQVSGRSDLPFDKRIALDLHYIDHWSIRLDFRILARTIPAVMSGKGAA